MSMARIASDSDDSRVATKTWTIPRLGVYLCLIVRVSVLILNGLLLFDVFLIVGKCHLLRGGYRQREEEKDDDEEREREKEKGEDKDLGAVV